MIQFQHSRQYVIAAATLVFVGAASIGKSQTKSVDSARSAGTVMTKFAPPAPMPKSFVADIPHALSAATHDSIDAIIRKTQRDTRGEIAVAILASVGEFDAHDVALSLLGAWHVGRIDTVTAGKKGVPAVTRSMGTVLLIVPKESSPDKKGRCWVASGAGMESVLSDSIGTAICGGVIIPYLKRQDYNDGIRAGVEAIAQRYRAEAARPRQKAPV